MHKVLCLLGIHVWDYTTSRTATVRNRTVSDYAHDRHTDTVVYADTVLCAACGHVGVSTVMWVDTSTGVLADQIVDRTQ